jgi:2-aminoethylphosphonate-pyruvate transaminase
MPSKLLFTPGPLTTSETVKQAMLRDLGSRDAEFLAVVRDIRHRLLALGRVADAGYEAVLMQGNGTMGIESVVSSVIPPDGKLLVASNGAYGRRIAQIARRLGIATALREYCEEEPLPANCGEGMDDVTHLAVVHCETSTGLFNPIDEIGPRAQTEGITVIVDAMSSFGGVELDLSVADIDFLISSANKCLEGVPGFSFILARRGSLMATEGFARTTSLDLLAQWKGLEADGQFRFTPPTHALLAFRQALDELETEGGVEGRAARYRDNYRALIAGTRALGLREYLHPDLQTHIITSFRYPERPSFSFPRFYDLLSERGFAIYPGKVSNADCFRIGTIGRLFPRDFAALAAAMETVLAEMGVDLMAARAGDGA